MTCPLCERDVPGLERHHLRTRRTDRDAIELICRECHKTIHGLYEHWELRHPDKNLDTVEGLLADKQFQRALTHIKRLPPGQFMKMKQARRRR